MEEEYLTAGEFARLARTTKRTVLWYDEKGILEPRVIDENGYRFYRPEQIIDFQTILLLRRSGFSLAEVKQYLTKGKSLATLFELKRSAIEQEIDGLQRMLAATNTFYSNLNTTGTLVKPQVNRVKAMDIYYIERVGPYAKIKDYCIELKNILIGVPRNAIYLCAFNDPHYSPRKAHLRIGVIVQPGMRPNAVDVQRMTIPSHMTLTYVHRGSGALLSLLWKELERYRRKQQLLPDATPPLTDLELYKHTSLNGEANEELMEFELRLPITR